MCVCVSLFAAAGVKIIAITSFYLLYLEIRGAHKIIAFMSATVIIIGGAVILALYGMST